jgi:ribonuclease D
LKYWRSEKAKEQNLPSYFIASNKELMSVAKYKPAKKKSYAISKVSESIK